MLVKNKPINPYDFFDMNAESEGAGGGGNVSTNPMPVLPGAVKSSLGQNENIDDSQDNNPGKGSGQGEKIDDSKDNDPVKGSGPSIDLPKADPTPGPKMRQPQNPKDKKGGPLAEDTEIDPDMIDDDNPGSRRKKVQGVTGPTKYAGPSADVPKADPIPKSQPNHLDALNLTPEQSLKEAADRLRMSNPKPENKYGWEAIAKGIVPGALSLAFGLGTGIKGMGFEVGYGGENGDFFANVNTPIGTIPTFGRDSGNTDTNGVENVANLTNGVNALMNADALRDAGQADYNAIDAAARNLRETTALNNMGLRLTGVGPDNGGSSQVAQAVPQNKADQANADATNQAKKMTEQARTNLNNTNAEAQNMTNEGLLNIGKTIPNLIQASGDGVGIGELKYWDNVSKNIEQVGKDIEGFFTKNQRDRAEESKGALPVGQNTITDYDRGPKQADKGEAAPRMLQAQMPKKESRKAIGNPERQTMVDYTETIRAEEEDKRRRAERQKRFGG